MKISSILSKLSIDDLEVLSNPQVNYIYADTLARKCVLQQKTEPNRDFYVSSDYQIIRPLCSDCPADALINPQDYIIEENPTFVNMDNLCKVTGINYYGIVDSYKKNICVLE
jgi:hypothetical protein